MHWKTTLALLLVTIGVGTYISLYEIKQPGPQRRERLSRQVVSIPPESVTEITIEGPQATFTLAQHEGGWQFSEDGGRADAERINKLLRYTASLIANRVLTSDEAEPLDPAAYGLQDTAARLTLVTAEERTTLRLGETTAVRNNRYLQREGHPEIYVVSPRLFEAIDQPADAFRDHTLVRLNPVLVDDLSITTPEETFRLHRQDGNWYLREPVEDRAEHADVVALLNSLGRIQIDRFLPGTLNEEARSEFTLTHGDPAVTTTIRFGAPLADDDTLVAVMRSDEPRQYAVSAANVEALLRASRELRERSCFEFFISAVSKVALSWQGASWQMARTEDGWRAVEADMALDELQVEDFLQQLADLTVAGFLETSADQTAYGLDQPEGTISIWTAEESEPQQLLVGAPIAALENRYGLIEARGVLIELSETITYLLETTPESLREVPPLHAFEPAE